LVTRERRHKAREKVGQAKGDESLEAEGENDQVEAEV
jgi:uncharacterized protein YjbJ (UPF0337 family)